MKHLLFLLLFPLFMNSQITNEQLDLIPWPQNINLKAGEVTLSKSFKVNITGTPNSRIFVGATNFLRRLDGRTGLFFEQAYLKKTNEFPEAELQINCSRPGVVGLSENETYNIEIQNNKISINATTDLGALHALETLLQLLQNNGTTFYFPNVSITDSPRFIWRGLMIDAARHFQPLEVIKRNLDAMASVKMNVFHWHLADDQGWRVEIKKYPKLAELASDGYYYTQEDIKTIVKYADQRGILVVPEIDVPGHASALLSVFPEIGSRATTDIKYEVGRRSGIYTPTLDPTNERTYQILNDIYAEVCPLFPGKYFHIGGDENQGKEWDANPKIQEFKKKNKFTTNHELQTYFTMKLIPMLKKYNKELMGWEEIMTKNMSKEAIIHSWKPTNESNKESSLITAAKNGYKTVLSNGFYIDLLLGIDSHYLNDPIPKNSVLTAEEKARILGGEATMWSELTPPMNIDSRIWPRTAAIAERLWSNENVLDVNNFHKRLKTISFRLEELGITHLWSKDVILRNIVNNQDITAVRDFSNVCEPLKVYKRNGGGKKYFMFSPLTLFADACNADAFDAYEFDRAVTSYLDTPSLENKTRVTDFLKKWVSTDAELIKLSANAPLIQPILPLSKNLKEVSKLLLEDLAIQSPKNTAELNKLLDQFNTRSPADVEVAVVPSLKKLIR